MKRKIELLKWGIKNTKMRVAHMEKHGVGDTAIKEKIILKKQERQFQLLKEQGKI